MSTRSITNLKPVSAPMIVGSLIVPPSIRPRFLSNMVVGNTGYL